MDLIHGVDHSNEHDTNKLLVGGLSGIVLGSLAGLLLAPKSGNKLREQLGDKYESIRDSANDVMDDIKKGKHNLDEKMEDWKDTLVTILDKFNAPQKKSMKMNGEYMDNIVDWATLGLRVYNSLQNRR